LALKQHHDVAEMLRQQIENARAYVLPFIENTLPIKNGMHVLEIGCGEGGVLKPFMDKGCICVGVDLDEIRVVRANDYFTKEVSEGKMTFLYQNIYEEAFLMKYKNAFDVIILKDVIEHIHKQEEFMPFLKKLMSSQAQVFFGFPPWYMPFGGHQQLCKNKLTSMMPYYHLLPMFMYKGILKMMGESKETIMTLEEIKETGISMERFEKIVKNTGYEITQRQWFLINPIYKYKFGLQPRNQNWLFAALPFVRNFLTTCAYYTIRAK
jgi:2-polyprenyl-3-methyl-5-hydroxy-6-metoxy-1,4-benzoquinol methylase